MNDRLGLFQLSSNGAGRVWSALKMCRIASDVFQFPKVWMRDRDNHIFPVGKHFRLSSAPCPSPLKVRDKIKGLTTYRISAVSSTLLESAGTNRTTFASPVSYRSVQLHCETQFVGDHQQRVWLWTCLLRTRLAMITTNFDRLRTAE